MHDQQARHGCKPPPPPRRQHRRAPHHLHLLRIGPRHVGVRLPPGAVKLADGARIQRLRPRRPERVERGGRIVRRVQRRAHEQHVGGMNGVVGRRPKGVARGAEAERPVEVLLRVVARGDAPVEGRVHGIGHLLVSDAGVEVGDVRRRVDRVAVQGEDAAGGVGVEGGVEHAEEAEDGRGGPGLGGGVPLYRHFLGGGGCGGGNGLYRVVVLEGADGRGQRQGVLFAAGPGGNVGGPAV